MGKFGRLLGADAGAGLVDVCVHNGIKRGGMAG